MKMMIWVESRKEEKVQTLHGAVMRQKKYVGFVSFLVAVIYFCCRGSSLIVYLFIFLVSEFIFQPLLLKIWYLLTYKRKVAGHGYWKM